MNEWFFNYFQMAPPWGLGGKRQQKTLNFQLKKNHLLTLLPITYYSLLIIFAHFFKQNKIFTDVFQHNTLKDTGDKIGSAKGEMQRQAAALFAKIFHSIIIPNR